MKANYTNIARFLTPSYAMLSAPMMRFTQSNVCQAFARSRTAVFGLAMATFLFSMAVCAPWIAPHDPIVQHRDALLVPPFWHSDGSMIYVLGTDDLGRDLLSRLIHGARLSLFVGVASVLLAIVPGVVLGMFAAFQSRAGAVIMRAMDILLALPSMLLAIAVVAVLGPNLVNTMIAIAIVQLPAFVRLSRAAALLEIGREYVTASRICGASTFRLMFNVVLPNCLAPLVVQGTLGVSMAILDVAALGFLGLGAQPPTPEWGTMLSNARDYVEQAYWVVTFPGLAILMTVMAVNLLGDGLRDALDPRLKIVG